MSPHLMLSSARVFWATTTAIERSSFIGPRMDPRSSSVALTVGPRVEDKRNALVESLAHPGANAPAFEQFTDVSPTRCPRAYLHSSFNSRSDGMNQSLNPPDV